MGVGGWARETEQKQMAETQSIHQQGQLPLGSQLLSDCPSSHPKVGRLTTCQSLPRVSSFPGSHGLGVCWDPSKWAEHSWALMEKRSSHSDGRQHQRDPGLRSWPDLLPALGADSRSPLSYPQLLKLLSKALLRLTGLMRCDFLSGVSPPLAFTLTLV